MRVGLVELYCGESGKIGYYNSQELGLAKALVKRGCEVCIFMPNVSAKELKEEILSEGIIYVSCPAKSIGIHSWYDWNIIKKYNLDIVQVGADNQLFAPNLMRFLHKNHIKAYCYIGTVESDSSNPLKKKLLSTLFKRNIREYKRTQIFVKTESVANSLKEKGINNYVLSPVGLDTEIIPDTTGMKDIIREKYCIDSNDKVILFVGRIEEYKRPFELLNLAEYLKTISMKIIVIGTGSLDDELDRRIEQAGLDDVFIREKKIPNKEIHGYYSMADYFVNFNDAEIFGMSILEAMYQGCTVIANEAPGPNQIIENNVSGYLVDKSEDMAKIILEGKKLNEYDIKNRIDSSFSWDSMAHKIIDWANIN